MKWFRRHQRPELTPQPPPKDRVTLSQILAADAWIYIDFFASVEQYGVTRWVWEQTDFPEFRCDPQPAIIPVTTYSREVLAFQRWLESDHPHLTSSVVGQAPLLETGKQAIMQFMKAQINSMPIRSERQQWFIDYWKQLLESSGSSVDRVVQTFFAIGLTEPNVMFSNLPAVEMVELFVVLEYLIAGSHLNRKWDRELKQFFAYVQGRSTG